MFIFNIDTSLLTLGLIGEGLILLAIVLMVVTTAMYLRNREHRETAARFFRSAMIVFIVLIITGSSLYLLNGGKESQIIISTGQITVNAQFIGNHTYDANQVKSAFVENINSGNVTLQRRDMGTSFGNINEGKFTMSNGDPAYVISDNSTVLVVILNSNLYLVLGSNNTTQLAQDFSTYVAPVPNY